MVSISVGHCVITHDVMAKHGPTVMRYSGLKSIDTYI